MFAYHKWFLGTCKDIVEHYIIFTRKIYTHKQQCIASTSKQILTWSTLHKGTSMLGLELFYSSKPKQMNIDVIRFQAVTVNNIDSGPNFLTLLVQHKFSKRKKRPFSNGNGLKWNLNTKSHEEKLLKTWMKVPAEARVLLTAERERNESRSDWIHAEITDRRKRRTGESQTRKAVITVL